MTRRHEDEAQRAAPRRMRIVVLAGVLAGGSASTLALNAAAGRLGLGILGLIVWAIVALVVYWTMRRKGDL